MDALYEKVQELKNKINAGIIGPFTALDLLYQAATTPQAQEIPAPPPVDNDHVVEGGEQFADPVPEPAPAAPVDEPPADEVAE